MAHSGDTPKRSVYILQSIDHPDKYYVGLTADTRARLTAHNDGRSSHTAKFKPWKLVHVSWFNDPAKAAAFEQYLKSGSGRAFAAKHLR